jgi:hypothetical protein
MLLKIDIQYVTGLQCRVLNLNEFKSENGNLNALELNFVIDAYRKLSADIPYYFTLHF